MGSQTDVATANRLVEAGEAALKEVEHPDPYISAPLAICLFAVT
jgi:hypothetical protein